MECKLKRFYGLSEIELEAMPIDRVMMYWKGIDMLESQEMISSLKVSEFPNMEASDKKKLKKTLENMAYFKQEVKVIQTSDIAKFIGMYANG